MSLTDPRIVYGARCAWWDSISEARSKDGGLPGCPHCGGVLYEVENIETWWTDVDHQEKMKPGYRTFIEWLRGQCFSTYPAALDAYIASKDIRS
jgi:hypothetical protein